MLLCYPGHLFLLWFLLSDFYSLFPTESPNLGNVFVKDNEVFLGGDRRPLEGSSSAEDEVEDSPHQVWDQLLAANMLPADVVESGIKVSDDILRAIFPVLTDLTIGPSEQIPAEINPDAARPAPWRVAVARDSALPAPPSNGWAVPCSG